jgi:putative ABC transport system ATP-binding protein
MTDAHLLEVKKLSVKLPTMDHAVLDEVALTVPQGRFVVVLGNNGSGKSSFLKTLNRDYMISKGHIRLLGRELKDYTPQEFSHLVHMIDQYADYNLFADLTVYEQCLLWDRSGPKTMQAYREHVTQVLPKLGKLLDRPVQKLSGGEKQAVILSLLMLRPPKLLLLDEHTSALDPKMAPVIMAQTHAFVRQYNVTCIMVTHNIEHAKLYGDWLVVFRDGHLAAQCEVSHTMTTQEITALL